MDERQQDLVVGFQERLACLERQTGTLRVLLILTALVAAGMSGWLSSKSASPTSPSTQHGDRFLGMCQVALFTVGAAEGVAIISAVLHGVTCGGQRRPVERSEQNRCLAST